MTKNIWARPSCFLFMFNNKVLLSVSTDCNTEISNVIIFYIRSGFSIFENYNLTRKKAFLNF